MDDFDFDNGFDVSDFADDFNGDEDFMFEDMDTDGLDKGNDE